MWYGLTQHMAFEDNNQHLEGEGIGAIVYHVPFAAEEGIFTSL